MVDKDFFKKIELLQRLGFVNESLNQAAYIRIFYLRIGERDLASKNLAELKESLKESFRAFESELTNAIEES